MVTERPGWRVARRPCATRRFDTSGREPRERAHIRRCCSRFNRFPESCHAARGASADHELSGARVGSRRLPWNDGRGDFHPVRFLAPCRLLSSQVLFCSMPPCGTACGDTRCAGVQRSLPIGVTAFVSIALRPCRIGCVRLLSAFTCGEALAGRAGCGRRGIRVRADARHAAVLVRPACDCATVASRGASFGAASRRPVRRHRPARRGRRRSAAARAPTPRHSGISRGRSARRA